MSHALPCRVYGSEQGLCPLCASILGQLAAADDRDRAQLAAQVLVTYPEAHAIRLLDAAAVLDVGLAKEHVDRIRAVARRYWNAADIFTAERLCDQGYTDDEIRIGHELYFAEKTREDSEAAWRGAREFGRLPIGFWR